jgi:chemotaxis protein CheD
MPENPSGLLCGHDPVEPQDGHRRRGHFLLPSRTRPHNAPRDGKYGDEAIDMLVDAIKRAGSQPRDYEAHLYGGADTMPDLERAMRYVGECHIEMGWALINEHSFQLKGVDVGGTSLAWFA